MDNNLGMKWIAYAVARVEGDNYYFQFDFNIPQKLYNELIDAIYNNIPVKDIENYDSLLRYAMISVDYTKLCGFYDELELENSDEDDADYYTYLCEYNRDKKRVCAELIYIRIFDPKAKERFCEYCSNLPITEDLVGKQKEFIYFGEYSERYSWIIRYYDADEPDDPEVKYYFHHKDTDKFLKTANQFTLHMMKCLPR